MQEGQSVRRGSALFHMLQSQDVAETGAAEAAGRPLSEAFYRVPAETEREPEYRGRSGRGRGCPAPLLPGRIPVPHVERVREHER